MSLINDALKRAQEAQKKSPPPPFAGAPLHAAPSSRRSAMPWIAGAVVLLLLGAGVGAFLQSNKSPAQQKIVSAPAQPSAENPEPQRNVQSAPPTAVSVVNTPIAPPPISPAPTTIAQPVASEPTTKSLVQASEVVASQPAWPKLKLQGIFYVPRKPSVVINGKALFIGERIADAQVVAITPESATLVFSGQTNVLTTP